MYDPNLIKWHVFDILPFVNGGDSYRLYTRAYDALGGFLTRRIGSMRR